ncbi:hypothetical protein K6L09_45630, partial [Burkholderia cepacia]
QRAVDEGISRSLEHGRSWGRVKSVAGWGSGRKIIGAIRDGRSTVFDTNRYDGRMLRQIVGPLAVIQAI